MKKMKWILVCMLALPLASNIKANNYTAPQKQQVATIVAVQHTNQPVTLIEQILFPHGI